MGDNNIRDGENILETLRGLFLSNLQCPHSLDLVQADQQHCVVEETPPWQRGLELL